MTRIPDAPPAAAQPGRQRRAERVRQQHRQFDAEPPGLPGFHAWRGVYLFVFGGFVLVVVLLAVFGRIFS